MGCHLGQAQVTEQVQGLLMEGLQSLPSTLEQLLLQELAA